MSARNPKRTIQAPGVMRAQPGHKSKSGRARLSTKQWIKKKKIIIERLIIEYPELEPARIEQLAEFEIRKSFRPR